ncbi:MAG: metallophosphoesterase family protein, partial [Candidatus Binatia bacterium]
MNVSLDSRRPATVLHTSDCHLGAGASRHEEAAFARAIALAGDARVDAVLIAGDLFDHVRVSEETLEWTAEQLATLDCPVVVIRGNHDVFEGRSVHQRLMAGGGLERVHVIDDHHGQIVEIPGTDVVVWGRAMIEHEPGYRPFAGLPDPPAGRWTIATGHGLVVEDGPSGRSSPIFASDLAAVTWDYVALGHVHAYLEVRDDPTPIRYPGATASSRGGTPGVVVVEFVPGV